MTDEERARAFLTWLNEPPPTDSFGVPMGWTEADDIAGLAALLRTAREEGERDAFAATAAFLRAGQRSYEAAQVETTDWRAKALRNMRGGK